ncbi:MAG: TraR/DksA C4-type zinc finger protein [Candidatus Brocadiae bacterium]|nr:TraR/DksA C4-type zinc finger protein [Candidatus Brocadiia bacterium]
MNKKELEKYKEKLSEQLHILLQNLKNLEESVMTNSRMDSSGDLTNIPTHIADISSDTVAQDLALGLIESEAGVVRKIQAALQSIEKGTYGDCEHCSQPISKKRLDYIPYTTLCIQCKSIEEKKQKNAILW